MLPRFFVDASDSGTADAGGMFRIAGSDAHYMQRVLRLQPNDQVVLCDGTGWEYVGHIVGMGEYVTVQVGPRRIALGEPDCHITLFQGLPKSDKMDWVVQKSVEIGVSSIVPTAMNRSVVRLAAKQAAQRTERWHRIAVSASQQAGRGRVPHVSVPTPLSNAVADWRNQHPAGLLVIPWEDEAQTSLRELVNAQRDVQHVGIVIGPEGGVTADEITSLQAHGGRTCTLGPRILRTETAGPVVAALILYELGQMGG